MWPNYQLSFFVYFLIPPSPPSGMWCGVFALALSVYYRCCFLYRLYCKSISGDWMTDRLTIAEKLAYDRAMGYVTIDCAKSSMTKEKTGRKNGTISLSRTQR